MKHHGQVQPVPVGLIQAGPLVQVVIGPHPAVTAQFIAAGQVPKAIPVKMMIDTGAQRTVIEQAVANDLGLTPIRYTPMVGVSQKPEQCPVYLAEMRIGFTDDKGTLAEMAFSAEVIGMASPPIPQQHRGLLGRDFLFHMDKFVYNGKEGAFDLIMTPPGYKPPPPPSGVLTKEEQKALRAKRKAERQARKKSRRK